MSGTPHGTHSIYYASGGVLESRCSAYFTAIRTAIDRLDSVYGYCDRIAYGNGGGGDGQNAFAVYRWPAVGGRTFDWYMAIQYTAGVDLDDGPTFRGYIKGGEGSTGLNLGISVAVAEDSSGNPANPWGGTTNNDGTDTYGVPMWVEPSGGKLWVFGASNAVDGDFGASRSNHLPVPSESSSITMQGRRAHVVADQDCFALYSKTIGATKYQAYCVIAPLTMLNDLSDACPLAVLTDMGATGPSLDDASPYGLLTGNESQSGGVASPSKGDVLSARVAVRPLLKSTSYQPNKQFSPSRYLEEPVFVYGNQPGYEGLVGQMDPFVGATYNLVGGSTLDTYTRVVLGSATAAQLKLVLPWDGATTDPEAGITPVNW